MRRFLSCCVLLLAAAPAAADDLFTSKVRPILAQHCFKCHGPDDKARKAKLRLDVRDEALKPGRSRQRAIVPGKPDHSEMIARILSEDETEQMPPPRAKLPLTAEQKRVLRQWVADGATYTPHWAFQPVRRPALPIVKDRTWPANPIDHFILARLQKEGLRPSGPAERHVLVRRVYLDLIGLPPTPEEADAFVLDGRPDAYERLVDRLLASPAYGERWARRWLDLARYADTNGYEKDRVRSIWPWRDWVIRSLNAGMPFDQFTIEQIAGDLLPGASHAQRVATGFHRNTMLNEEGGIDPLEFRFHAVADRVATTGTVWLGLTLGCAQCHTHKYDPISHREYYQLFAFLNNADEPDIEVVDEPTAEWRRQTREQIAEMEADLVHHFPIKDDTKRKFGAAPHLRRRAAAEQRFEAWLAEEAKRTVRWQVLRPSRATSNLPLLTVQPDSSVLASGDQTKSDAYELTFPAVLGVTAVRLEVLPDARLPHRGPGRVYYEGPTGDFFLSEISLFADGRAVRLAGASHSHASGKHTAALAIDGDPQTGWSIDGGQGRPHAAVFRLPTPATGELKVRLLFERFYAAGLGRFRISVTSDPTPVVARPIPADVERLLLAGPDRLQDFERQQLFRHFLRTAPELAAARKPIDKLRLAVERVDLTLVMQERPPENPRPTHLHHRGEFLQPRERVEAAVPAVLHPLPKGAPANRLSLARWLVAQDNPLVGRVTVNREWAAFFGTGLVATTQDFGLQGELPSHPELLDWLADEFRRDWSLKRLHRLIVTSRTYRQASAVSPALLARDPKNRLLARGPRLRLEAEIVRDSVLRASGLLALKVGGASVFPPQPPGVTTEGAYGRIDWRPSPGLDRFRRGLYTFRKRTAPFAFDATFDGPSGEVCVACREVSNTPLQALTLLNDAIVLEAAQELGRRLAAEEGDVADRVRLLFRRVLTRPPSAEELKLLVRFFEAQKGRFERKELNAAALAGPGDGAAERAAWVALARVLFNLDEAIARG